MGENEARNEGAPLALPRDTTPTWEVELLISGVAVFAMLQLPDLLDRVILDWAPRFVDRWAKLLWLVYVYTKSAALILATTFVIHLLLRARWIALVGMASVYPRGVSWDHFRLGPNAREIESARMGKMADNIERADNRATIVFAMGVVLASVLFALTLIVTVVLGLALLLESWLDFTPSTNWLLWAMALFIGPYAIAMFADRRYGAALAADGVARRVLRGVLHVYNRLGVGMANNPALALLSSHHGRRRTIALVMAVFMVAMFASMSSYRVARAPDTFGSYDAFPAAEDAPARTLDTANYDDRRDPLRDTRASFIQSAVVTGPYVQLVVPFDPDRDADAMQRQCPQAKTADARLECLQRVRNVSLDGHPLPVRYDIGRDARTERPALVAMIDVRALPHGRHALEIARPMRAREVLAGADTPDPSDPDARAGRRHETIPFWR